MSEWLRECGRGYARAWWAGVAGVHPARLVIAQTSWWRGLAVLVSVGCGVAGLSVLVRTPRIAGVPIASAQSTPSASPTPSTPVSPKTSPTPEIREASGIVWVNYEWIEFYEVEGDCPGDAERLCFSDGPSEFWSGVRTAAGHGFRYCLGSGSQMGAARIRFVGEFSVDGGGSCLDPDGSIRVVELLEVEPTTWCGRGGPDLAFSVFETSDAALEAGCAREEDRIVLRACVANVGPDAAGAFEVWEGGEPLWAVDGLESGAEYCASARFAGDREDIDVEIDPLDAVAERNENNNCMRIWLEPSEPVPVCPGGRLFMPWAGR